MTVLREDMPFPFMPVVIIGAGRSGTNALRDALTQLPGFTTWPCDEINPIWRHGNLDHPDDAIPPENATPAAKCSIRRAFRRIWRQHGRTNYVVEKTCANTLRVPFVDAVLPEARYVHIVRNGYDVVASARKRWRGDLEMPGLPYFLAKARYAPLSDLPRYAVSAIRSRLAVRAGARAHLKSWGPRFTGIDTLVGAPLEEICARQWAACISRADEAFAQIAPERVMTIRYEDFTADPKATLAAILKFLEAEFDAAQITEAVGPVRATSVGKGKALLDELPATTLDIMKAPLAAHGYGV